jgi:hypothetical protein
MSQHGRPRSLVAYNALQTHVEKRMSHGLMVGFSFTYSHATDEQSALGLFYGSSDFDRSHVFNFNYVPNGALPPLLIFRMLLFR